MTLPHTPRAWAARLTLLLNQVMVADRFPVRVADVAREFSRQVYPQDPIIDVMGGDLPGFEGALVRVPERKGWGILYNKRIAAAGRINFTLAHEFGHYLLHRVAYPQGIRCSAEDVSGRMTELRFIEREADLFAADLLMPLDDFRRQIGPRESISIDQLSHCADHYEASLIAVTLRWLAYTERRAIMVVSRDGFILWARSSENALKTRAYFKTSQAPVPIPEMSLAAQQDLLADNDVGVTHAPGVWLREEAHEMTVFSQQYDFAISLLMLGDAPDRRFNVEDEDDPVAVATDVRFRNHWAS